MKTSRVRRKSVTAGATKLCTGIALSLGLELRSPTSNENTESDDWLPFAKERRRSFDDFKPGRIKNGVCIWTPGQGVEGPASRQVLSSFVVCHA
jgi:hypothetical protein